MIKVAVVLLNWNGKSFLQEFLPSVVEHSNFPGTEIFVVDNGSDDKSVEYVGHTYPFIKIIRFEKNFGFAAGYHKALLQIRSEYFVLLNTDVQVTTEWLSPLINVMEKDRQIAACMPKIKSFSHPDYFEYAGASGGFIDFFGYPFCRGRILDHLEKDYGQYDDMCRVFWASGACLAVRNSSYFEAGGLDRFFFAHMEEIDLCWRLQKLGYYIYCVPDSVVFHVGGGSLPNNNPRKIYLNYRNSLFLLFKNLSSSRFIPVLLSRIIMDVLSAVVYLFQGSFGFFLALVKAHCHFYKNIPLLVKQRKQIKTYSDSSRISEIYSGSIVFEYFIRKKRTFSKLYIRRH